MNMQALDEVPASVHAETSIISLLASSISVPDGFPSPTVAIEAAHAPFVPETRSTRQHCHAVLEH
jgi:hypothetical protein